MNDDIIDLTRYLARDTDSGAEPDDRSFFSVWGGDGDRSRFALPLWRSIYLAAGRRAGLVWTEPGRFGNPRSFFVLDLGSEPARTEFEALKVPDDGEELEAPRLIETPERILIHLGSRDGRDWFMVLEERDSTGPVAGKTREDLMFLAGECAGLLFKLGLHEEV